MTVNFHFDYAGEIHARIIRSTSTRSSDVISHSFQKNHSQHDELPCLHSLFVFLGHDEKTEESLLETDGQQLSERFEMQSERDVLPLLHAENSFDSSR